MILYCIVLILLGQKAGQGAPDVKRPALPAYFGSGKSSKIDEFRAGWYGTSLKRMDEPSLAERAGKEKGLVAYRFLWLRTFHRPISIRLEVPESGDPSLVVKELDGQGGYDPGKLKLKKKLAVQKADVERALAAVQKAKFWEMPTDEPPKRWKDKSGQVLEERHADGAQWVIEGVRGGKYHVVDRWCPSSGAFYDLCMMLINLSGLNETDVY